jgi:hypothetical protein
MMNNLLGLILLLTTMAGVSCQTKQLAGNPLTDRSLVFGRGGGVTGIERTWILMDNGQVLKQEVIGANPAPVGKISASKARLLFNKADEALYGETNLTEVGNTYSFIGLQDSSRSARLVWTGTLPAMNPTLAELITEMEKIAK